MKKLLLSLGLATLVVWFSTITKVEAQTGDKIYLGAYYFDGWQPEYQKGVINDKLTTLFPERTPIWGWQTSTPDVMKKQIDAAADAGIKFFSFDWYYPNSKKYTYKTMPLNHALGLYSVAPNKSRLKFNLMVINQKYFVIGPDDWDTVTAEWIRLFKDPQYVKVDGKPLITFFTDKSLIKSFGSVEAVRQALDKFRLACKNAGFKGVTIATGVSPAAGPVQEAAACGFDLLTGYSYRSGDIRRGTIPIEEIQSTKLWDRVIQNTGVPFMPVITLNWDPRTKNMLPMYKQSPVYVGYSAKTVYNSIQIAKKWMADNPNNTTKERVAIMYAWNEYNEGAWLTPSVAWGNQLLDAVKKAVSSN
jgi:hypothetical protein